MRKKRIFEEIKAEKFPSWIKKSQPINAKGSKSSTKKKKFKIPCLCTSLKLLKSKDKRKIIKVVKESRKEEQENQKS